MSKDYKRTIEFISMDGKNECTFKTETNKLNGNQMWWIEPITGMYSGTKREVKKIEKSILDSCKIISVDNKEWK